MTCPMKTGPHKLSNSSQHRSVSSQGGFVLIIALVVLAAMTLAAAAMVRTVDTSTLLARNISFKRDAVNRNDFAIEAAMEEFRAGGSFFRARQTEADNADRNFSAVMLATDADGVPLVLKANTSTDTFTGGNLGLAGAGKIATPFVLGMKPVYLIERMCTAPGPALVENCIVNGRSQAGGTQPNDKPEQLFPPLFRITARVTGPRNTVSYVQTMFSYKNT